MVTAIAAACSGSPKQVSDPVLAAERLATDLGLAFGDTHLRERWAAAQSVLTPWYAFDSSTGRTVIETLDGDMVKIPMEYWTGTLWATLVVASSGEGYCLQVAETRGSPIAWWVRITDAPKGALADQTACSAIAGS